MCHLNIPSRLYQSASQYGSQEEPVKYNPHPSKRHRQLRGAPRLPEGMEPPPEMWFEQRLASAKSFGFFPFAGIICHNLPNELIWISPAPQDHFHPTDERSWRQRYWVSEKFRRPGGPAFLMIGGEGPENPVWMEAGTWTEYAREFGATMFLLEHR